MAKIPKSCANRHHSYPTDAPGAVCTGCGRVRRARDGRALGAERAQSLRAALGVANPAASSNSAGPVVNGHPADTGGGAVSPDTTPPPASLIDPGDAKRKRLAPRMAKRLTQVFIAATGAAIERWGRRVPNDPEPEDVAEFEEGLSEQLRVWMPEVELSPPVQMAMAGVFIVMEQAWNAEKLLPPAPKIAATTTPTPAPPPPSPPAPPPNGVHDADSTRGAETLLRDLDLSTLKPPAA